MSKRSKKLSKLLDERATKGEAVFSAKLDESSLLILPPCTSVMESELYLTPFGLEGQTTGSCVLNLLESCASQWRSPWSAEQLRCGLRWQWSCNYWLLSSVSPHPHSHRRTSLTENETRRGRMSFSEKQRVECCGREQLRLDTNRKAGKSKWRDCL